MLIAAGKLLMLLIWGVLLANLIFPFPSPVNSFINAALAFTALIHSLQLWLLTSLQKHTGSPLRRCQQWRIFIFGAFELLTIGKNQQQK